MSKSWSREAPICSRCRARADARRGRSLTCLSCGHPYAVPPSAIVRPSATGTGTGLWLLVGVLGLLFAGSTTIAVVLFAQRADARDDDAGAPIALQQDAQAAPLAAPLASASASGSASASASAKPAVSPLSDEELDELAGNYTCKMDDTPAFPCRIAGGTLEKLAGSQRFKGPVSKLGNGNLAFSGTFFCPFGDCTGPVATTFVRRGPGRYVGNFGPGGERVVLVKVR